MDQLEQSGMVRKAIELQGEGEVRNARINYENQLFALLLNQQLMHQGVEGVYDYVNKMSN